MPPLNDTACTVKKIKIQFSQGSSSLIISVVRPLPGEDRDAVQVRAKHLPKESVIMVKHRCCFEKQLIVKEMGIFAAVVV